MRELTQENLDMYCCEVPQGWLKITESMLREIYDATKGNDEIEIEQIKEKYGELTVYYWSEHGFNGNEKVNSIIENYERISRYTCCVCGKPATNVSLGWICPWCMEHKGDKDIPISIAYNDSGEYETICDNDGDVIGLKKIEE